MKKIARKTMLCIVMFSLLCGITACGEGADLPTTSPIPTTETEQGQTSEVTERISDSVVRWADSTLEEMVRKGLNKPTGDILESDLSGIKSLRILGDSIVCVDNNVLQGVSLREWKKQYEEGKFIWDYFDFALDEMRFSVDEWWGAITTKGRIKSLEDMAHFSSLETLTISNHNITELTGVEVLKNLKVLELPGNNIKNAAPLSELTGLERLELQGSRLLVCDSLSSLVRLRELVFECSVIEDVDFLSDLTEMEYLHISGNYISNVQGLAGMKNLEYLQLETKKLKTSDTFADLQNLKELVLWTDNLEDINGLGNMLNLESLTLSSGQAPDLQVLSDLPKLRTAYLMLNAWEGVDRELNLAPLSGLTELTTLGLDCFGWADENTDFLATLTELKVLHIGMRQPNLNSLRNLQNLEVLDVCSIKNIDLRPVSSLTSLKELHLLDGIKDISAISSLKNLTYLDLFCYELRDIRSLVGLENLEHLMIQENKVEDFSILKKIPNLKILRMDTFELKDASFLADLTDLEMLTINLGTESQFDSGVLAGMQNLQVLQIRYSGKKPNLRVLTTLPNLQLVQLNDEMVTDLSLFASEK